MTIKTIEPNEGTRDRVIRAAIAAVMLAAAFRTKNGLLRGVLIGFACHLGATAATGFCPAYAFAGFDTLGYRTPVLKMGSCGGDCQECQCSNEGGV